MSSTTFIYGPGPMPTCPLPPLPPTKAYQKSINAIIEELERVAPQPASPKVSAFPLGPVHLYPGKPETYFEFAVPAMYTSAFVAPPTPSYPLTEVFLFSIPIQLPAKECTKKPRTIKAITKAASKLLVKKSENKEN